MTLAMVALLVLVGAILALIIGWMSRINTDKPGFAELTGFADAAAAGRAREILERAGIPVILDDHHGRRRGRAVYGVTRVLVAQDRIADATAALHREASYVEPKQPPA